MSVTVAAELSAADVTKSLETIKRTADEVAAGRYHTQQQLRDPARIIGTEWDKIEPSVAKDFLVETRFANRSIATFERDWKSPGKAKSDAKDVSAKVTALLSVQRQNASPAPSAPGSPPPSATASPAASPSGKPPK